MISPVSCAFRRSPRWKPSPRARVELVEYHIPQGSLLDGMALKNVAASLQVKVLVCAVRRGEEVVIPDGNYVLGAGDCISVTAKPQELENFFRRWAFSGTMPAMSWWSGPGASPAFWRSS